MLDQTTKLNYKTYYGASANIDFTDSETKGFTRFASIDKLNFTETVNDTRLLTNKPESTKMVIVIRKWDSKIEVFIGFISANISKSIAIVNFTDSLAATATDSLTRSRKTKKFDKLW